MKLHIPQLIGVQPITATWLWEQHNEHRIPLPKLILVVCTALPVISAQGCF